MNGKYLITALLVSIFVTGAPASGKQLVSVVSISDQQVTPWYNENIYTRVNRDGYIYTKVWLSGAEVELDQLDMDSLLSPPEFDIFRHGSLSTWETSDPTNRNLWIRLEFETNNPASAENLANEMVNFFSAYVEAWDILMEGSYGYDQWNGNDWVQYTAVEFSGHIDWTNFKEIINRSIPRENGGLAATVDPYPTSGIDVSFWRDGNQISGSIGLAFNDQMQNQTGGHVLSIKELARVDWIGPSYLGSLTLQHDLPKAENVTYSIGNTSTSEVKIYYHPSPEEQNEDDAWSISVQLTGGNYSDITIGFDYTFTQYSWRNTDQMWFHVDARGYVSTRLEVMGKDRAALTQNLLVSNSSLYSSVISINFHANHLKSAIQEQNVWLDMYFNNTIGSSGANETAELIMKEIESLGLNFISWQMDNTSLWIRDQWIDVIRVSMQGFVNQSELITAISSSYVYSHSASWQAINLTDVSYLDWWMSPDRWGPTSSLILGYNALDGAIANATPSFVQGVNQTFTLNLYDLPIFSFGGTIPWNNETEEMGVFVQVPFQGDFDNLTFVPETNNGIGWSSSRWHERWERDYVSYGVWVFSSDPKLTDQQGNIVGNFTTASVTFSNTFFTDNEDLESPRGYIYIETSSGGPDFNSNFDWLYGTNNVVNGTQRFAVLTDDVSRDYYNGTDWVPRFPSSGINNVTGTLFRDDTPVDHPLFNVPVTFSRNATYSTAENEVWETNFDTTSLPDGRWNFDVKIEDNGGNVGSAFGNIVIDNYNESYQPATITWELSNDSTIEGIVDINFQVTDDVGAYAVIFWKNLGGNAVSPTSSAIVNGMEVSNYTVQFDTLTEGFENQVISFTVEVLDMDGHWSRSTIRVTIDNLKTGNPPTVALVSPIDGITVNITESPMMKFEATVTDDWGLKSVNLEINGETLLMSYNETTGNYEVTVNIGNLPLGDISWRVIAVDVDENEHTVTSETRVLTTVGIAPPTSDTTDPTISVINPSNGANVSGTVTFEVSASDDVALQQVTIELPDGTQVTMEQDASGNYVYDWDSTQVVDGEYTFTFKAVDTSLNSATTSITIIVSNGRAPTLSPPEFGLPGLELPIALASFIAVTIVKKRKKTN